MNQTTRISESTRPEVVLHMALELGASEWRLGFGVEAGRRASQRKVVAGDWSCPGFVDTLSFGRIGVPDAQNPPPLQS
jgi:hypothetical protein